MTHPGKSSFLSGTLPSYKNPPVNEVVCGMRFQVPDKLRIPHIGLLWDKFRVDYPIVNVKQATRTEDEDRVPLLVLELKARRIGESTGKEAIREWFDLAHEWIVQGFTDLTTPEIQKIWE